MKVGVTGSSGFLGWHVRAYFKTQPDKEIVPLDRELFEDAQALAVAVGQCDVILHLAGGRVFEEGVDEYRENMEITERLIAALNATGTRIPILFASSASIQKDTPYGRAKRDANILLREWGAAAKVPVSILVITNMFGEFAQPFHHTVSATFCAELAADKPSTINGDGVVEFVHARDVVVQMAQFIEAPVTEERWVHGTPISVPELYERLRGFRDTYRDGVFPGLATPFDVQLFNMLYSVMFKDLMPRPVEVHADERGSLVESVRTLSPGQTFSSVTKPGGVRGNHYHTRKIERFMVLHGNATIRLRKLFDDEILTYEVSGEVPVYIDMPTYYTHSIENTGASTLTTLFWTNELFDADDPDTFSEPVR